MVFRSELLRFENSEPGAQSSAQHELALVVQQLIQAIHSRRSSSAEIAPQHGNDGTSEPRSPTPGLDLLAALTQTPRDALTKDSGAIARALGAYFSDIGATVADALRGEPSRSSRAQERMAEWSEILRGTGVEPDPRQQETQGGAEAPPSPPESEPPPSSVLLSGQLRELAERLRRRADALAAERDAERS